MSYSTLYIVFKTKAVEYQEYNNGWGTLPAALSMMTFISKGASECLPPYSLTPEETQVWWNLWQSPLLTGAEKFCILLCYDNLIVLPENFALASEFCLEGHNSILTKTDWTWSHFEAIGKDFAKLAESKLDYRAIGAGLNCTSIHDVWSEYTYLKGKTGKKLDSVIEVIDQV